MDRQTKENPEKTLDVRKEHPEEGHAAKQVKEHRGGWKINEALQLLDEAAKEKQGELSRLITEKYANIREAMTEATRSYTEAVSRTRQNLSETVSVGEEKLKEMTIDIDKRARENPWLFLGIAATGFFLAGYMLAGSIRGGRRYK